MITTLRVALYFVIVAQGPGDRPEAEMASLLRAVADAYEENRARFNFGSVEFEYWDGYARNLEAATRGDLNDAHRAEGSFAFDGPNALYSRRFSDEAMAATTVESGGGWRSSRLDSLRVLTNGMVTFTERVDFAGAGRGNAQGHVISPGVDDFFQFASVPLDLGRPQDRRQDLAAVIRMVLDGKAGFGVEAIEEGVDVEGVSTIRIALKLPNGMRTYWVDLERGSIPIRVQEDVAGGNQIDLHHGDIRYVEGRGWLPFAMTTFLKGGRVKRLVVERAAFASPPARETFRIELDRPTAVANVAEGRGYTARTVYDLNNLPGPSSRESTPLGTAMLPGRDLSLPGVREAPRPPYFTIGAIAIACAVAVIAWRRARSA